MLITSHRQSRITFLTTAFLLLGSALTACSDTTEEATPTTDAVDLSPFSTALRNCETLDPENYDRFGVVITDDVVSFDDVAGALEAPDWIFQIAFDQEGDATEKPIIKLMNCIHEVTDLLPVATREKLLNSVVLDGMLTDTSEGIEVTWSSSRSGIGIVIERARS